MTLPQRLARDGPSLMAAEMAEQPAVLRRLVARSDETRDLVRIVVPRNLRGVVLVGRGSSANAAYFGRNLAELATGRPALVASPAVERLYRPGTDYRGYLAVGLSQSGRTPEVVETLLGMRDRGATTVALTADRTAAITDAAEVVIDLETGVERAVPSTKSFVAQLAALVLVAEGLGAVPTRLTDWRRVVDALESVLDDACAVDPPARALAPARHLSVIGSGLLEPVAWETALKLQEAARLVALPHSAAAFRHGPLALAGADHPVVAVLRPGRAGREALALLRDVRRLGSATTVICSGAAADLRIPAGLPEPLAAIPAVVRGQQLALAIARLRNLDPDAPPALTKVTLT